MPLTAILGVLPVVSRLTWKAPEKATPGMSIPTLALIVPVTPPVAIVSEPVPWVTVT